MIGTDLLHLSFYLQLSDSTNSLWRQYSQPQRARLLEYLPGSLGLFYSLEVPLLVVPEPLRVPVLLPVRPVALPVAEKPPPVALLQPVLDEIPVC